MKTIKYTTVEVYDKISKWWEAHNFPVLPINFLPYNCFIISKKDKELYAVFMYATDSALCWLAFPVSNPDATKEEKEGAMTKLFLDVESDAREHGFTFMFTTSPLPVVQDAFLEAGYSTGDTNVNHYMKILKR